MERARYMDAAAPTCRPGPGLAGGLPGQPVVRAHVPPGPKKHAAGGSLGRSRGGFHTQIHALTDGPSARLRADRRTGRRHHAGAPSAARASRAGPGRGPRLRCRHFLIQGSERGMKAAIPPLYEFPAPGRYPSCGCGKRQQNLVQPCISFPAILSTAFLPCQISPLLSVPHTAAERSPHNRSVHGEGG